MSDFAAVATPQSGNFSNPAYEDAVQRAKRLAQKIKQTDDPSSLPSGKRPLDDGERTAFGAQLAALQQQRMNSTINAMVVEDWKVPDKMVGLIIGRGGEQIGRLQAESGCKIQMAADAGGMPDRACTLTGTKQAIERAKEMVNQIINRGAPSIPPVIDPNQIPDGHTMLEMLIPGGKVGLVIGKGGETIRNLQERAGVKMVMIQEGPNQTMHEKPLRITGEPQKCEYAKQLIMDLITEKELEVGLGMSMQRSWQPSNNDYGGSSGGNTTTQEVMVPRQAVGVVIGKQGDMIKRIQQETGARVQFQMGKEDSSNDRACMLTGTPDQCQNASTYITELIQSVLSRDQQMGRGRGRGRPFEGSLGGAAGGMGGPGSDRGMGRGGASRDLPEIQYSVPANKCGLVIGKGGETIRNINQQSGAHVELSRNPPPNHHDKVFCIRGTHQQIEHAQQLINEKINGQGMTLNGQGNGYGSQYPYQQATPGATQSYSNPSWNNGNYQSWPSQGGQPGPPQQSADPWASTQSSQPVVSVGAAPVAGAAAGGNPDAPADYSAAWAEYYRSMGMFREAEMIEQQARAAQAQGVQPYQYQRSAAAAAQPAGGYIEDGVSDPTSPAGQPGCRNYVPAAQPGAQWGGIPANHPQPNPPFPAQQQAGYPGYNYS